MERASGKCPGAAPGATFIAPTTTWGSPIPPPLRPRDWPKGMVVRAAEFAAQLPQPAGSFTMAYLHFLDRGDWQRALTWLDKARLTARPAANSR